ncbi:unnamed protein product [[Candida] boidinii]|nr:unnamed protein product [[Candida] boidinii]
MARTNARLIRFAIFAIVLIFCGYILSKGASTNHSSQSSNNSSVQSKSSSGESNAVVQQQDNSVVNNSGTVKATFVSLARNSDLWELVGSIRHVEDRFNSKFKYDWVFLNDEEFNDEFKKVTSQLVSGNTYYGLIPKDQWSFPSWIDVEKAAQTRQKMREANVIYGDSISYRHMCRYESGFFFRHPLLEQYEYYWRVEPGIKIYCDIDYDLFKFMKVNDYKYSFTISLPEYPATIETLWDTMTVVQLITVAISGQISKLQV